MRDWKFHEARGNIGLNLIEMKKYIEAIDYYSKEIESDPDNDDLYFWRGRAYREAGLAIIRRNNHNNTDESLSHFQNSNNDYKRMLELCGEKTP